MPQFVYTALEQTGRKTTGQIEAANRLEALRLIKAKGLLPVDLGDGAGSALWQLLTRDMAWTGGSSADQLVQSTREWALLLQAHMPPADTLDTLAEGDDKLAPVWKDVADRVRQGETLAQALSVRADVFSPTYVSLVRAGQESGALASVIGRLADQLERAAALKSKLTSALIYPAMLTLMAIGTIVVLVTVVVPAFEPLFRAQGAQLPLATRVVVGVSNLFSSYGWILGLALAGLIGFWIAAPQREAWLRKRDSLVLRLPLLGGVMLQLEVGRSLRLLATLVQGGVPLQQALKLCADSSGNRVVGDALQAAAEAVLRGAPLSRAFGDQPLLPRLVARLLRVGEASGGVAPVLGRLADLFEAKADLRLNRFLALLTPALTLGLGLIAAVVLLSVLTAMLDVNQLVQ
jgi:general secretion pathway protein F